MVRSVMRAEICCHPAMGGPQASVPAVRRMTRGHGEDLQFQDVDHRAPKPRGSARSGAVESA